MLIKMYYFLTTLTYFVLPYPYHHFSQQQPPPGPWWPVGHPSHNHPPGHPWHRPEGAQIPHDFHHGFYPDFYPHLHPQQTNHKTTTTTTTTTETPITTTHTPHLPQLPQIVTNPTTIIIPTTVDDGIENFDVFPGPVPDVTSNINKLDKKETSTESIVPFSEKETSSVPFLSTVFDPDKPLYESKLVKIPQGLGDDNLKLHDNSPVILIPQNGNYDNNNVKPIVGQKTDQSPIILIGNENSPGQKFPLTPYELPDVIVKDSEIVIKSPNAPKIHIKTPIIVINDDDDGQTNPNRLSSQIADISSQFSQVFGSTNLNDEVTQFVDKQIRNVPPKSQDNKNRDDLASQINRGEFGALKPINPVDLKNMSMYNPEELEKIQKELNESIKKGLVDYYKGQLADNTTETNQPGDPDLRVG